MSEIISEAAAAAEPVLARELGWGVREVLHWLIDRVSRPLAADAPTAAEVHAAVEALGQAQRPAAAAEVPPAYGG